MNPCNRCKKKANCAKFCKAKLDYLRHLNKIQRKKKIKQQLLLLGTE